MKTGLKLLLLIAGLISLQFLHLACAGGNDAPSLPGSVTQFEITQPNDPQNRKLLGVWEIGYNTSKLEASIRPARELQAHFEITDYLLPPECDDCIQIQINSFDPNTQLLDLDVTLYNPTDITVRDVRGIVYTDDYGHLLTNDYAWTALYDIPGGEMINPFRQYGREVYEQKFEPQVQLAERFIIRVPDPPQFNTITFAVDASWPGNCEEPFQIRTFHQSYVLNQPGYVGNAEVKVLDWQNNVNKVEILIPDVCGPEPIEMSHPSSDARWEVDIANSMNAPVGEYDVLITAYSGDSGDLALYKKFTFIVTETPLDAIDLTPPWFNIAPLDVTCSGDGYAYTVSYDGEDARLDIFDITNPENPVWIDSMAYSPPGDGLIYITGQNGYVYITSTDGGFIVVDVDPPGEAQIVASINTSGTGRNAIYGDYCYLLEQPNILQVIDINPPEESYIVNSIESPAGVREIKIEGDFAYVTLWSGANEVTALDLTDPEAPTLYNTIEYDNAVEHIEVNDGFLYAKLYTEGLVITDISNPNSPVEVYEGESPSYLTMELYSEDGFLYILDNSYFYIMDVDPPESTCLVKSFHTTTRTRNLDIIGQHLFMANTMMGLRVYDISVPENTYLAGAYNSLDDGPFTFADGLLYGGGTEQHTDVSITDPYPLESINTVSKLPMSGYQCGRPEESGNNLYRYVAGYGSPGLTSDGLAIIDVSNTSAPELFKLFEIDDGSQSDADIQINGNLVYLAHNKLGLMSIDISDPGSPNLVSTLDFPHPEEPVALAIKDDYAYVTTAQSLLHVIKLSQPGEPHIVHTIEGGMQPRRDLIIHNNRVFILNQDYGLRIVDISEPESAEPCEFVVLSRGKNMRIVGDVLYVLDDLGLRLLDVSTPGSTTYMQSYQNIHGDDLLIDGNYAFITGGDGLVYELT